MSLATELKTILIHTPDGDAEAHLAVPKEAGKYPAVLFLMDAFGVRPVIDEWIERIAAEGYVVLAPNLLYRSKAIPVVEDMSVASDPEKRGALFQGLFPMIQVLTPDKIAVDAKAYLDTLADQPETKEGPAALAGYCMGARIGIRIAAAEPDRVALLAGFHGGHLVTDAEDSPHLVAPDLKTEVFLAYADHDQGATPEDQAKFAQALTAAGVKNAYETYKDAPHGYTMRDTAAYREEAAERHFAKLIELLKSRLS